MIVVLIIVVIVSCFQLSSDPARKIGGEHHFFNFRRTHASRIEAGNYAPHGSTYCIIDRDFVFFERFETPHVGKPFGPAATEYQPYFLILRYSSKRIQTNQNGTV